VVGLSWTLLMVSPSQIPFVVSLSNHALCVESADQDNPALPRKAWFDELTTNGIRRARLPDRFAPPVPVRSSQPVTKPSLTTPSTRTDPAHGEPVANPSCSGPVADAVRGEPVI